MNYRDRLCTLSPPGDAESVNGWVEWTPRGITSVSESAASLFGVSCDFMVGRTWGNLFADDARDYLDAVGSTLVDGTRGSYVLRIRDGTLMCVQWEYRSRPAGGGRFELNFWPAAESPGRYPRQLNLRPTG